ncbi:hypothetical protein 2L372D_006 [Aeromonas phage 2L372D]|uniref:Uncharacterized protein n=1 Tax=Aeromonas phage 2L372D TaxID=2588097 RepID=A0A4Y5TWY5_9CAUD|nr:hypothetical protein HWC25_gp006 [Aeromonas phage 2L372D]QDB73920.1 hypothetical protein 2L372D_006 [Aeromonas phage 2L372D]
MAILLILLDNSLFYVQQQTIIVLIFLLCLHSCISNSNESHNTNDNHSYLINSTKGARGHSPQLIVRRIENLNVNDYHLAQGDSGQPQRQLGFCNL